MIVWITVLAIVVIALVVGLSRLRGRPTDAPSNRAPTVPGLPVETGATIRSYVMPKRWLRSSSLGW